MDIKIVGSITDENTLEEIESIMKVFVYEQRMKNYMSLIRTSHLKKDAKFLDKKIETNNKPISGHLPHILVKGLC